VRTRCFRLLAPFFLLGVLFGLGVAPFTPAPVLAFTELWTGLGGDANWTTAGNWVDNVAPQPGFDLQFPAGASRLTSTNNLPANPTFPTLTILGSGYTLNGNSLSLFQFHGIGTIAAGHPSGTTSTINFPVAGGGTTVIDVTNTGATLVFGGNVDSSDTISKNGVGTAVLLTTGVPLAGWVINAGILNLQHGGALGGNNVRVNPGSTLQVQGDISVPSPVGLGSAGAANATGGLEGVSGSNMLTGGIQLFGDSTVSVDAGSTLTMTANPVQLGASLLTANVAGAMTIASPIQGTGGLIKTGTGALTLSGTNTYAGPTAVNAGTLLVNGSQPASSVTVASGATLGGMGTMGPVTINGILSPGVGGSGILHSGNATFNLGSTVAVDLNGTTGGSGYDQLFVTGTVSLGGPTLAVSVAFPSVTGDIFTIVQSTGAISGGFSGLPEGFMFPSGGRTFRINYTPNTVTLTDVTPAATATPTPTPTATPCILGDINCDGIVDIRDYGIWRANFGQTNCGNPADLDGTCIVDIRDYGIWRANFGHTAGAVARTATPLPAPRGTAGPTGMAPRQAEGAAPSVPLVPLVGGLLGLGGLAGWRARRPPRRD
jgi:autotransporter-associated beta strand protein